MAYLRAILVFVFTYVMTISSISAATQATTTGGQFKGPVVYVFGDSMSDVGNNNYLPFALAKSDYPWYGIDYYHGMPTGRFSNGKTIGDYMAEKFGIPSQPPYMSLSMTDDKILQGVNFASGGAGILKETGIYFVQYLSFDSQINCFEKTKEAIKAKIGDKAAEKLSNEALYLVALGSNDYINNFLRPFMADGIIYTHDEFLAILTTTLSRQFKRLYKLGARKIVFDGLAPLGCIPSQRTLSGTDQCLTHVNEYAKKFNMALGLLFEGLKAVLPGAQFHMTDCYSVVMDLIDNPQKYGFKSSHTSCCNVGTTVGGLCLPTAQVCKNRKDFVFWDAYHTSDAANKVIADKMFADLKAVVDAPTETSVQVGAPTPAPQ